MDAKEALKYLNFNVQIVCVSTPTTRDYEAREKFFSDMVNFLAEPLKPEIKGGLK